MANTKNDAAGAETTSVTNSTGTLSINEFCVRLSETVTRPELIGGFAASERAAGSKRDTAEAFKARYEAFINKPV